MSDLKNIKKDIISGRIFIQCGSFLSGKIKNILFLLFFGLSFYCGYIWYTYVYNPSWSEEKKTEYLKTKDKEVTFNRKKFQDIVEKEKKRGEEYQKKIDQTNDIFRIGQPQPQPLPDPQTQPQPEPPAQPQAQPVPSL
jgi:hypothetical protein